MPRSADALTIHRAFRSLSKALHPDTTSLPIDQAARKFQQLCEAYELLSDPKLRKEYDKSLAELDSKTETVLASSGVMARSFPLKDSPNEVRRPFSGGELFSLLLLGISLLISLLLAVGFALMQGKELQVRPSWLMVNESIVCNVTSQGGRDVSAAFS